MEEVDDILQFVRGAYCYGWVAHSPNTEMQKFILQKALNAIGKLSYGVPVLKHTSLFVHLDVAEATVVRQLHLLARRKLS